MIMVIHDDVQASKALGRGWRQMMVSIRYWKKAPKLQNFTYI